MDPQESLANADNDNQASFNAGAELSPVLLESITYAAWQNSVALLRGIDVQNSGPENLAGLQLRMEFAPAFARSREWVIERLLAGSTISISDCKVELDADYLSGLNEAERGQVSFRLWQGDKVLTERTEEIRLLARDEWGGFGSGEALIAAFVMPNDPGVTRIIREAADILASHGQPTALNGYQSADPKRAYLLAAAIWNAVAAGMRLRLIRYITPSPLTLFRFPVPLFQSPTTCSPVIEKSFLPQALPLNQHHGD